MSSWTLLIVSFAGLVGLLGRLPLSTSVLESFVTVGGICIVALLALYGITIADGMTRLGRLLWSHVLTSLEPILQRAHA